MTGLIYYVMSLSVCQELGNLTSLFLKLLHIQFAKHQLGFYIHRDLLGVDVNLTSRDYKPPSNYRDDSYSVDYLLSYVLKPISRPCLGDPVITVDDGYVMCRSL